MPRLDPLLRALVANEMDALVLEPGRLPRLRRGHTEREVTRSELDGGQIGELLREISPTPLPAAEPGASARFSYRSNERELEVVATASDAGWAAEIRPAGATAGATADATTDADAGPGAGPAAAAGAQPAAPGGRPFGSLPDLLGEMTERGASDLHLSAGQPAHLRIDGDMTPLTDREIPDSERIQQLLDPLLPERNRRELAERNDTDFGWELPDRGRFRVNVFRDRLGVGAVFRQIPTEIPTFEDLHLPDVVRRLARLSKGLVLVTGPTGSGKSTTLAAILDLINRTRREHIITIEDPIEFVHRSRRCLVNQREVGVHTTSFKAALRAALREDPDIVMVGEMRDLETIAIAVETAETGHLVFGTLHTTTAPSTVERLVDQFPGDRQSQIRMMLADSLRAVIAQALLKRREGGRVGAYEILMVTPAVSNLIREGKTFQIASAMQTGKQLGMRRLGDSLFELVEAGVVSPGEAYLKAVDKEALETRFRAAGIELPPQEEGEGDAEG